MLETAQPQMMHSGPIVRVFVFTIRDETSVITYLTSLLRVAFVAVNHSLRASYTNDVAICIITGKVITCFCQ